MSGERRLARRLTWPLRALRFLATYLRDLVSANVLVAREVVTPVSGTRPAVVRVPVADLTPAQVVALANLVSLTPGTLTIDVDEEREAIYVHALHTTDAASLRDHVDGLRRRMLEGLW